MECGAGSKIIMIIEVDKRIVAERISIFLSTEGMESGMGFLGDWGLQSALQGGLEDAVAVWPGSSDAGHVGMARWRWSTEGFVLDAGSPTTILFIP